MHKTIAITGLGLTSSLGQGVELNWTRLLDSKSGIEPLQTIDVGDYPIKDGGEDPPPPDGSCEEAAPEARHLVAVCQEALARAGIERVTEPGRVGLSVGSSLAASTSSDTFFESFLESGPAEATYASLRGYYIEDQLAFVSDGLGIRGPSLLVSNACAAGASAVARGGAWIRSGRSDIVVVAGYDAFSVFTFAGFGSLMALSRESTRPFSSRRDGMKLGAGYAALILESLDHATARGKRPLAMLSGYGESSDAHHLTHPHPEGLGAALAMRRALATAKLEASAIDAINCHGTATPSNDAAEAAAMKTVFGDRLADIPICASKPAVGHTLGGAGAVESVISVLSLVDQKLPPTLSTDDVEEQLGPLDVVRDPRPTPLRHVMSNSFGFGGSNASLIFGESGASR